jgi:hypothetical protein
LLRLLRQPKVALAIFLLVALAARVAWVKSQRRAITGDPPIGEVEFYKHWITVTPVAGTSIAELVDMSFFGAFRPGMTFDDAVAVSGNPANIRRDEHNVYYEYEGPTSRVEIGREEYSTGGEVDENWALYAYPYDRSFDNVLIPQIAKHVTTSAPKTGIQIKNSSGRLALFVQVLGRRVDHMIWLED